MKFTKMHGIGNDYVYVNCFKEKVEDPSAVSVKVSRRHFSVGSDGLILICPSDVADFKMDMYNADGSRGKMCGNGIRCVGKYVYDYGLTDRTDISVETLSGIKYLKLNVEDGKVRTVRVSMGAPILAPREIPVKLAGERVVAEKIEIGGRQWEITCVSMGNPHCIVYVDNVKDIDIEKIGPAFEKNPLFPESVNTEFIELAGRDRIKMRVWERGSGETLACGTGACASVVASALRGYVDADAPVTVELLGGELQILWDREKNDVFMTGPAAVAFEGEIDV